MDGNIEALNRYLKDINSKELMAEQFDTAIQDEMEQIIEAINNIFRIANSYENEYGFDFKEYAEESIKELISSMI